MVYVTELSWTDFGLWAEAYSVQFSCKQVEKIEKIKCEMTHIIGQTQDIASCVIFHSGL